MDCHSKFAESRERHVMMIIYVLFGEIAYLTCAESRFWQTSSAESPAESRKILSNFESYGDSYSGL